MSAQSQNTLECKNVGVSLYGKQIISDINFSIKQGDWLMITGPNGSGKTTLIRALTRDVKHTGQILLDGKDSKLYSAREFAKNVSCVCQQNFHIEKLTVMDVVAMGRYCYQSSIFGGLSIEDNQKIDEALDFAKIENIKNKFVTEISGGEYQKVLLAQTIAQDAKIMIFDEPANNLDEKSQTNFFENLLQLAENKSKSIITVVHNTQLSCNYGNKHLEISN